MGFAQDAGKGTEAKTSKFIKLRAEPIYLIDSALIHLAGYFSNLLIEY
jgi:hypothetical protein